MRIRKRNWITLKTRLMATDSKSLAVTMSDKPGMFIPFGLLAIGGIFVYSGMKGKSVVQTLQGLPDSAVTPTSYTADIRAAQQAFVTANSGGGSDSGSGSGGSGVGATGTKGYVHPFPSK